MLPPRFNSLIEFLQSDIQLSKETIAIAFRYPILSSNQVPVALWQMGLITLEEVSSIFDWLETHVDCKEDAVQTASNVAHDANFAAKILDFSAMPLLSDLQAA